MVFDACVTTSSTATTTAPTTGGSAHPLDRAAWSALTGPHARFAIGTDRARRYPADVAPFAAVESLDDPRAWNLGRSRAEGPLTDLGLLPAGEQAAYDVGTGVPADECSDVWAAFGE